MTRSRYRIFDKTRPHFMTSTIVGWLPVFSQPKFVDMIYDSWRFLQRERDVLIFGYVILENHLHWVAKAHDLSEQSGRFKSYIARQIIDRLRLLAVIRYCSSSSFTSSDIKLTSNFSSGRKEVTQKRFRTTK